jgi:flagellar export protein FliJ
MKPFAFRLDRILGYRKYLEKLAQADLIKVRNELVKIEKQIQRMTQKKTEVTERRSSEEFRGLSVPEYQIYQAFLVKIENDLKEERNCLQTTRDTVVKHEAVLREKSIKKKIINTLKDLQHTKYLEISAREEQKVLDEMVITRKE